MSALAEKLRAFRADQTGQTTIEYALLLVVIGLPMVWVFGLCLGILAEGYRMVTFLESLPLP